MKELSVNYGIGFADSNILSFSVENRNVTVLLECWNAVILEIKFLKFIFLSSTGNLAICNLIECFESPLMDSVINDYYEKKPKENPFREFKFITDDDITALGVICEDLIISKIEDSMDN